MVINVGGMETRLSFGGSYTKEHVSLGRIPNKWMMGKWFWRGEIAWARMAPTLLLTLYFHVKF
jgi:hypothetical protein